jgi:hypothetical protein
LGLALWFLGAIGVSAEKNTLVFSQSFHHGLVGCADSRLVTVEVSMCYTNVK